MDHTSIYIEVERSPNGRYIRYNSQLGHGSSKIVWKALDTYDGRLVAWNCTKLNTKNAELRNEISILKTLKHQHILHLHDYWQDPQGQHICFITDLMPDGRLHDYVSRLGTVNRSVVKNWSKQILLALDYLHSQSPPIVHRDLKCDNIFIDSSTANLKLGDFGLSTTKKGHCLSSMIGTPAFMAIEIFDENYTEKIDIYAFGMTLLEIITGQYPYEECNNNPIQVWKQLKAGIKPLSLALIQDPEITQIINLCLESKNQRPSAKHLLSLPFFNTQSPKDHDPIKLQLPSIYDDTQQMEGHQLQPLSIREQEARGLESKLLSVWV